MHPPDEASRSIATAMHIFTKLEKNNFNFKSIELTQYTLACSCPFYTVDQPNRKSMLIRNRQSKLADESSYHQGELSRLEYTVLSEISQSFHYLFSVFNNVP